MILWKQKTTAENTQATGQIQIASSQAAEKAKQDTETVKGDIEIQKVKIQEESAVKVSLSAMFTSLMKDGNPVPTPLQPMFNAWVENTMIPMLAQNEEQKAEIIQKYQQAQQQPVPEEQNMQQPEQPINNQQPEQMAA